VAWAEARRASALFCRPFVVAGQIPRLSWLVMFFEEGRAPEGGSRCYCQPAAPLWPPIPPTSPSRPRFALPCAWMIYRDRSSFYVSRPLLDCLKPGRLPCGGPICIIWTDKYKQDESPVVSSLLAFPLLRFLFRLRDHHALGFGNRSAPLHWSGALLIHVPVSPLGWLAPLEVPGGDSRASPCSPSGRCCRFRPQLLAGENSWIWPGGLILQIGVWRLCVHALAHLALDRPQPAARDSSGDGAFRRTRRNLRLLRARFLGDPIFFLATLDVQLPQHRNVWIELLASGRQLCPAACSCSRC